MNRRDKMKFEHVLPADIEKNSMRIIGEELAERGIEVPEEKVAVVKRVIHTTADFDYAENLRFTEGAVEKAVAAFAAGGKTIITDTNMALAGISKPSLAKFGDAAECYSVPDKAFRELGWKAERGLEQMCRDAWHFVENSR